MKYILLIGIVYFFYRFYIKKDNKQAEPLDDFPREREKEQLGDFTDYEEIE